MKRNLKISLGVLSSLALLLAAGFGWNYYHQRTLSPEVKAAVVATLGDNTTLVDATVYLRSAKLAIRTKRDADVVARLDKAVASMSASQEHQKQSWQLLMEGIKFTPTPPACLGYGPGGSLPIPALKATCLTLLQNDIDQRKRNSELEKVYDDDAKTEMAQAKKLIVQLRADVQLPALPETKK